MSDSEDRRWIEVPSPWFSQPGTVRILQKRDDLSPAELAKKAWRDELEQPYILDTAVERRMHFKNDATQSAMLLAEPDALVAQYTRKMMAFLLFNPNPRHIALIGLGGGSLPKFCYRHLPGSRITVVEIDADVIALRDEFCVPKDDERFRVVHDDGARFVERLEEPVDAFLVDAFDADGIALSLARSGFHASAARGLTADGMLVMNLWGPRERALDNLLNARAAFGDNLVLVPVLGDANVLLFAFKQAPPKAVTDSLETAARRLQTHLTLDFPRYLRRICQGQTLEGPREALNRQLAATFRQQFI